MMHRGKDALGDEPTVTLLRIDGAGSGRNRRNACCARA
jgi:hypothetical protein